MRLVLTGSLTITHCSNFQTLYVSASSCQASHLSIMAANSQWSQPHHRQGCLLNPRLPAVPIQPLASWQIFNSCSHTHVIPDTWTRLSKSRPPPIPMHICTQLAYSSKITMKSRTNWPLKEFRVRKTWAWFEFYFNFFPLSPSPRRPSHGEEKLAKKTIEWCWHSYSHGSGCDWLKVKTGKTKVKSGAAVSCQADSCLFVLICFL